jgi:hypothetical protein
MRHPEASLPQQHGAHGHHRGGDGGRGRGLVLLPPPLVVLLLPLAVLPQVAEPPLRASGSPLQAAMLVLAPAPAAVPLAAPGIARNMPPAPVFAPPVRLTLAQLLPVLDTGPSVAGTGPSVAADSIDTWPPAAAASLSSASHMGFP